MKRAPLAALFAASLTLMLPGAASGAGGPVQPVQGNPISVAGSPYRYVAEPGRNTVIRRLAGAAASVSLLVPGQYGIPAVAYDGSLTGLSADGRTLIVAQIAQGAVRTTRLLVLDTPRLSIRARLALPGWSTIDGISPDGRWLYLIQYASSDASKYAVRAYDLVAQRYLAKPVVDPHDRGEAMVGFPLTRAMSADDRWAYTLYYRPSGPPFVHALDTAERRAVCVDLPSLSNMDTSNVHLALGPGGTTLRIESNGLTQALLNTRTFVVTRAAITPLPVRRQPARPVHRSARPQSRAPWALIGFVIVALALIAAATMRSLRRGRAVRADSETPFSDVDGERVYRVESEALEHADAFD